MFVEVHGEGDIVKGAEVGLGVEDVSGSNLVGINIEAVALNGELDLGEGVLLERVHDLDGLEAPSEFSAWKGGGLEDSVGDFIGVEGEGIYHALE